MDAVCGADIALFLGKPLVGPSERIHRPADLAECGPGDLVWLRKYTKQLEALLEERRPSLVICDWEASRLGALTIPSIYSQSPRLDFVKTVTRFFVSAPAPRIDPTAIISEGALVGSSVGVGAYARLGPQVMIGDRCQIGSGVSVEGPTCMGSGCIIKANAVIGAPGFGFEYDTTGVPLHFPHVGRVVIEDDVWIGACSTVERASLGITRLCSGCKIDDLVQVGHNVTIGRNTLVMAHAVLCGGATIGDNCWIAPHAVVKEHVRIGSHVTVGLGSVVLSDIEGGLTVAGVPARPISR